MPACRLDTDGGASGRTSAWLSLFFRSYDNYTKSARVPYTRWKKSSGLPRVFFNSALIAASSSSNFVLVQRLTFSEEGRRTGPTAAFLTAIPRSASRTPPRRGNVFPHPKLAPTQKPARKVSKLPPHTNKKKMTSIGINQPCP